MRNRHALLALAEMGHEITGVESSPAMLEIARAKADEQGLLAAANLIEGDFSTAALGGPYPFAFTLMNTFLHLPDSRAQLRALRHWRDALLPGGLLLIDILAPDVAELAALDGRLEWQATWESDEPPGKVMKFVTRVVDPAKQVLTVNHIYDEIAADGALRRTVAGFDLRYLWRYEAELLLERAGFEMEAVYGDWGMSEYGSDSDRMILVAKRKR